jgi:hypothetical protein
VAGGRSRSGTGLTLGVVAVIAVAIAAALASGATKGPTSTPFVPSSGDVSSLRAPITATPGAGESGTGVVPSGAGSPRASSSVAIDPTLLEVLPSSVAGTALTEDPATEQHDATDPSNAGDLAALAVAVAVDGATGDLGIAAVVRTRPGVFSDAYYADWRAAFDAGACSQANGVASTAESTIGGHDTFSATCSGGLITYHVHLADRGLIVSISSLGQGQFGRLIVEGLR